MSDSRAEWTLPLHQPDGQSTLHNKLLYRLEGLHQLHLVLPPEGIALGHTRESRPRIWDHNAGETMAPSGKYENRPSPVT